MTSASKSVFSRTKARDVMRSWLVALDKTETLNKVIQHLIKYKLNALLLTGPKGTAEGVVSKTDLMTAYYGEMPLSTPAEMIMVGPPSFCRPGDSLEAVLEAMSNQGIHRLYVAERVTGPAVGVVAYPDLVGFMYRVCRTCPSSHYMRPKKKKADESSEELTVGEVMSHGVKTNYLNDPLHQVMEELASGHLGASLILDSTNHPLGVVSKSDLARAYLHQRPTSSPAGLVMAEPCHFCSDDDYVIDAVRSMIFHDYQRIFVRHGREGEPVGVLSLSDAARFRSGSCKACVSARLSL
jgi:signal-transduction protein with cAMP-binding, CBS, and nucleotidyltransferase domain